MNYKRLHTTLAISIIALCALSVQAQSGRRQTKSAPAAPVPTPTPEATPIPKQEAKAPEIVFFVATDRNSSDTSIPLSFHSAAQRACANRLRARSSAEVDEPHKDVSRGEAIEKAKKSSNTYVLLLTLKIDHMSARRGDLVLEFLALTPTTAKVLITGRAYLNQTRTGPIILGPTSRVPSGVYLEQWFREAGEEVADKLLKKLNMGTADPK